MSDAIPGPLYDLPDNSNWLDDGTLCRAVSPFPGPVGISQGSTQEVSQSLAALEATALNFGRAYINDASVRENYVRKIKQMSAQILEDVRSGRASAEEGTRFAQQLRNQIMEQARGQTSPIGRAQAEKLKAQGKTLATLVDDMSARRFPGKTFAELSQAQRREVFEAIIKSAGKSRPTVTARIANWRLAGRGLVIFTAAIATYNIWTAENKVHAGLKEGIVLGSGVAGGAVAGAATGLVCGPGAPICSSVLFVVGGIMGALAGSAASDHYDAELAEFADWLGEGF